MVTVKCYCKTKVKTLFRYTKEKTTQKIMNTTLSFSKKLKEKRLEKSKIPSNALIW